jgi:FAD:protein FMN transferase
MKFAVSNHFRSLAHWFKGAGSDPAQAQGLEREAAPMSEAGWRVREEAIMGTAIRVELWAEEAALGDAAAQAVMAEMHRIDRAYSPFKPESELSRLNREAGRQATAVSEELFALLARALEFSRLSGGAFDISFAGAGHLYDYRRGLRPGAALLAQARASIGWQHLELDARAGTVRFAHPGTRIDLGGFAKGYAADNGAEILARHGIRHALVSAGGDSRLLGDKRGRPWNIAVRDPRHEGGVVAVLPLADVAISTSGDYERCFVENGVRHHHVLDPRTGESARRVRSVTVIASDGLTSEALSKTVFVQGAQQGLALIDTLPGVDALVVDAEGQLHVSASLRRSGPAPQATPRPATASGPAAADRSAPPTWRAAAAMQPAHP